MELGEAIKAAIEYEAGVHRTYKEAMEKATDEDGRRVFRVLRDEEKGHLDYLNARLAEWNKDGKINIENLETAIPTQAAIDEGVQELRQKMAAQPSDKYGAELQMLEKALEVEIETSNFYKRMVQELDGDGQKLFERFVEIEMGHQAIVQAEIDCVNGMGFWFDTAEFSLESG